MLACDGRSIAWRYRFVDADVRERAAVIEGVIHAGGCEGEVVHAQTFGRDQDAAAPPRLSAGAYGFEVIARDAECLVVGRGCEVVDASSATEVTVDVLRRDDATGCDAGDRCDAGRCVPAGDGGVPCGCVDESGACRAGDELTACGAGGGSCEVCCGGGVDACEAGRCVPLESRQVRRVSAGEAHTCALLEGGEAQCWGSNEHGQLAAGALASSLEPLQIGSAPDWITLGGASRTVCGSRASGGPRCWGWNFSAQVGTGSRDPLDVVAEQPVATPEPLVEVYADRFHSCGRAASGAVYCWGSDGLFALWQTTTDDYAPVAVVAPDGAPESWDSVHVGLHRTCLLSGGEQWCAGYGAQGRIGVLPDVLAGRNAFLVEEPIQVAPEIRWSDLALGVSHSCGLDDAGRLYCWGCGGDCDPATDNCDPMNVDSRADTHDCSWALGVLPADGWYVELPELVDDGPFLDVAASEHTCVILDDGGGDGAGPLVCFGPNEDGQLGAGTTDRHGYDPSHAVMDGARFRAVSTGLRHTCAIRDTGALYCWGFGDDRALGTTDLAPADPTAHEVAMRRSALEPRRACID